MYARSSSATAPKIVSMNFPVGVVVSMASFWETNSTPLADGLYDDGVPLPHEGKQILEFWPAGVFAAGLVDVHLIHPQLRH